MSNFAILGVLTTVLLFALVIAIPAAVGIYVYRDASRRKMNAVLWTFISIFAPGFIGLIIYLIVRSEHTGDVCPSCGKPVRSDFIKCPYCTSPLRELCLQCGFPLEEAWESCPSCGAAITAGQKERLAEHRTHDKGLGAVLTLVIILPVLVCVMLGTGIAASFLALSDIGSSTTWYTDLSVENVQSRDNNISQWVEECDAAGEGVYVLSSTEKTENEVITKYLIYRNDGYWHTSFDFSPSGWFSPAKVTVSFTSEQGQRLPYNLCYYEYSENGDGCGLEILSDSRRTEYTLKSTDTLSVYPVDTAVDVFVDRGANAVFSVSCTWYSGDVVLETENTVNADNSTLCGNHTVFSYDSPEADGLTSVEITVCDRFGNQLSQTRRDISPRDYVYFRVCRGNGGSLLIE